MTLNQIKQYTDQLGLTCDDEDCQSILDTAIEWNISNVKDAVWEYLDCYEGISHCRDTDYWATRDASEAKI
jgi:hypothetical protein